jgi:hypothetical protein
MDQSRGKEEVIGRKSPFPRWAGWRPGWWGWWGTEVMGSERLTGALLGRLTHRVHIIEANGESYRLKDARKRRKKPRGA